MVLFIGPIERVENKGTLEAVRMTFIMIESGVFLSRCIKDLGTQ